MSGPYYIGIDGGTQSCKVSIFDTKGNLVSSGRQALLPISQDQNGSAIHPGDDVWHSIVNACQKAMAKFPFDPATIAGVGLCTIRCCRVLLNSQDQLAQPVISWMDERLSKPYEHADNSVAKVTTTSGYVGLRLTGQQRDSAANQEGCWPLDKQNWDWSADDQVWRQNGLRKEQVFSLVKPTELHGYVSEEAALLTTLPKGLPVYATANDKAVEALGAGLISSQDGLISLGTYIAGMQVSDNYVEDNSDYFCNLAAMPNCYLLESAGIREGMRLVTWLCDLTQQNVQQLNTAATDIAIGSDGLAVSPDWLAPPTQPHLAGCFIGLRPWHGAAHMYRAVLEAIALRMIHNMESLCSHTSKPSQLLITGGGSHSDLFMQIFADVCELPCTRMAVPDAAGLGAAICAAVGDDHFSDFDIAVQSMVNVGEVFNPINENVAAYQTLRDQRGPKFKNQINQVLQTLNAH